VIPFDGFKVPRPQPGESEVLDLLFVLYAASGELLAAYTEPRSGSWPIPMATPEGAVARTLADVASVRGRASVQAGHLARILSVAWESGANMWSSMQVVARPMAVATRFPARKVGDEYVAIWPEGPAWLVSALGVRLPRGPDKYDTQSHVIIDDKNEAFILGFRAP